MAYGKMRDEDTNQTGLYVSSPVYTSGIGVPDYSTLSGQYDDVMGQILEDYPNYGQVYVPEEPTNLTQSNQSDGSTLSRTAQLMLLSQSGNNGSYAQPVGKVTVSGIKYSGAAPTLGQLPTYKAPEEWSGTKMASETAKKAALGLRQIRQALREATAGLGNDPASRLALRKALAQHGINVQGVMSSAQSAAETSEANELARKAAEAQANFQAELTYLYQKYQSEWNKYLATGKSYSITSNVYESGDGGVYSSIGLDKNDILSSLSNSMGSF